MGVPVAIGTGVGADFFTLAKQIAQAVGYSPKVAGDETKQASSPHTVGALAEQFGWQTTITLEQGIRRALQDRCDEDSRVHLITRTRVR